MKSFRIALTAISLLIAAQSAHAQAIVVQTCGTLAAPYTPGNTGRPIVMDVNGNQCGSISQGGNTAGVSIDGNLLVNTPPASQFFDAFSAALDTTTNWTANNSTGTAATSAGSLVISSSTTASAWGGLGSKQSWAPQGVSLQVYGVWATFTTKTIANSARVWGMFTVPGSPSITVPVTDGYVWRLDGAGSLFAEIWATGVAVSSTNVTAACGLTNSVPNTYAIYFRTGLTQFYCGAVLAATVGYFSPTVQTLPASAFSIAGSTPPLSSATMTLGGLTLATYSPAGGSKAAGQAPTINDPSQVVTISPNSPALAVTATIATTGADVAVTPTIQNASYVSGNCMGGFQTVALGTTTSVLSQVSLASQGGLATAKQVYIFSANPSASTCTDKSTFTIATADLSKVIYTGSITPAAPTGTTKSWASLSGLALGIPSGGTVYAAIVETATETPASTTDIVLTFSAF